MSVKSRVNALVLVSSAGIQLFAFLFGTRREKESTECIILANS